MFLFEKLLELVITKTFPDVWILFYLNVSLQGMEGLETVAKEKGNYQGFFWQWGE